MPACFVMRDRKATDLGGRGCGVGLGGVGGGETVNRIYFMEKKKLFSIKEEK